MGCWVEYCLICKQDRVMCDGTCRVCYTYHDDNVEVMKHNKGEPMAQEFMRGTKTGKTYNYADCLIWWDGTEWLAHAPNSCQVIARGTGIKPVRNELYRMKLAKEGPWQ